MMTAPPQGDRQQARDLLGIPLRGILIGAVLALVLNICDTYATNAIQGSYLTLNFSTPAALFLFFFLVLASAAVGLLHRWLLIGAGAQHLRYLRDQCDPRFLPDPQLQHPGC